MPNAINYFEISGPDAAGLRAFYRDVLGLSVETPDESGYAMVSPSEGAIPGAIWDAASAWTGHNSYAVAYIQVDGVDATVVAAQAAGATVVVAPCQHGPTRVAHLLDPAGNRVGIYQFAAPAGR